MNGLAIRNAGRYLGAWVAIVLFVVLLSFVFTILGTISCAVLAGMMMGAFKGAKWFSVSVSLVFPGVILGLARGAKVDLAPQQVGLLAVLCFGTFWVTYLVSAFVLFCEQKGTRPSKPPATAEQPESLAQGGLLGAAGSTPAGDSLESTVPAGELCLEQLQGNWVCEASGSDALCRRIIQFRQAKLELKAIDANGRTTLLAAGDVTLQGMRHSQTLVSLQEASKPGDFMVGL